MTVIVGRKRAVGIGIESSYGVEASSVLWVPYDEFTPGHVKEDLMDESSIGRVEKTSDGAGVRKSTNPSLSLKCKAGSIGMILKGLYGIISTTSDDPEAGVNTHNFLVKNDSVPVSYSIFYKDDNTEKVIKGAIIDTAKLNLVQNDYVGVELALIGIPATAVTKTPAYLEDTPFTGAMATVKMAETIAGLPGATADCFQEATIEFSKEATQEEFYCLGSTSPNNAATKSFDCTGTFTRVKNNDTFFDKWDTDTKQAILFELIDTGTTIGAGTNPKVSIELAPAMLKDYEEGAGLDDIMTETFGFQGLYSISDAKMTSAELINTSTY